MKKMEVKLSMLVCFTIFVGFGFFINGSGAQEPEVGAYELKKGKLSMTVTNYGARIMSIVLPDKYGNLSDIALGFDTAKEYTNSTSSFGAVIGRVAGRISNAQFTLNGTVYQLARNYRGNHSIHGGLKGFARVIWKVEKYQEGGAAPHIVLSYHSVDGDQGFPGDLYVNVTYTLHSENQMSVEMRGKVLNKATPINLVPHIFLNLGGHNSGDILSEEVQIFASKYTPVDNLTLPTGEIASVKGTPYDFLKPSTVGSKLAKLPQGYDTNFALDGKGEERLKIATIVRNKKSGRVLELFTNQPGMGFYTSNTVNLTGKGGFQYRPYSALVLETQGFPDAVNHPNFPSTILTPGNTYEHDMLFKFSTMQTLVRISTLHCNFPNKIVSLSFSIPLSRLSLFIHCLVLRLTD